MSEQDPFGAMKALGEGVSDASKTLQQFGTYMAPFCDGPFEQMSQYIQNKFYLYNLETLIKVRDKIEWIRRKTGKLCNKKILVKDAIPLLEGISVEDNSYLQNLWAYLLVNSTSEESNVELRRMYIDLLERLRPLEAEILGEIYKLPYEENKHKGIITGYLKDYAIAVEEKDYDKHQKPNNEITQALSNLIRLGCISSHFTYGGGEIFYVVHMTRFGRDFYNACSEKPSQE